MTAPLVRLPATVLDLGGLADLAACVGILSGLGTVLVGPQRSTAGDILDEFVVAAALRELLGDLPLGIAARVADGRSASIIAREATASELLGACDVLLLEGDAQHAEAAAAITSALFLPGEHTLEAGGERIDAAVNLPQPEPGRPVVCWHDGESLWMLEDARARRAGDVVRVRAGALRPSGAPAFTGALVVVEHPLATPDDLAAALAS